MTFWLVGDHNAVMTMMQCTTNQSSIQPYACLVLDLCDPNKRTLPCQTTTADTDA